LTAAAVALGSMSRESLGVGLSWHFVFKVKLRPNCTRAAHGVSLPYSFKFSFPTIMFAKHGTPEEY
jgi:hypothetical protein